MVTDRTTQLGRQLPLIVTSKQGQGLVVPGQWDGPGMRLVSIISKVRRLRAGTVVLHNDHREVTRVRDHYTADYNGAATPVRESRAGVKALHVAGHQLQMQYVAEVRQGNLTRVTEFILLGLPTHQDLEVPLFFIYLVIYILTVMGNILIILITMDPALHTPMYFFLRVLSFLEICYISVTVPRMLMNFLSKDRTISYTECAAQMFFLHFLGISECFLLASMAYDRYTAICHPLRYHLIMNKRVCLALTVLSWLGGNVLSLVLTIWVFTLPFCGSNQINYFFCDIPPLIKLACTDTFLFEQQLFTITMLCNFTPFCLILISYVVIISTILKMASAEGRQKAFSTCSSHLIVVTLYYGSSCLIYLRPKSMTSLESNKVLALVYTTFTPILNPVIYSLRNKEVKGALRRLFGGGLRR